MLFFYGFLFIGLSGFDAVRHTPDALTSVSVFLGVLAFAAAYSAQNIERRLASIEKHLHVSSEGGDFLGEPKDPGTS